MSKSMRAIAIARIALAVSGSAALSAQDKYTLQVPGGLAFSEFRGYETWLVVALSYVLPPEGGAQGAMASEGTLNVIVANPAMIQAYTSGFPGNGKPWPDGAKMAKIQYSGRKSATAPFNVAVPNTLKDVAFMAKDSKRFADSGGWGWAIFKYDGASDTFTPFTLADQPPQGNDAKCGFACHTIVKNRDYVFTEFGKR